MSHSEFSFKLFLLGGISSSLSFQAPIMTSGEQLLLDQTLFYAAGQGDEELLANLLLQGANPTANQSAALRIAAAKDRAGCARILMPISDLSTDGPSALLLAAENGSSECVELFVSSSSSSRFKAGSKALQKAAENGHAACVAILIPVSKPKTQSSRALLLAATYGRAECVALLIPHSNPAVKQSQALAQAAANGHAKCVELLIPVSDVESFGGQALRSAAFFGHAPCVAALLENASLMPAHDKAVALRIAVCKGHVSAAHEMATRLPAGSFDAEALRAEALACGHGEVVALFDSLREQSALALSTVRASSFSAKSRL